MYSIQNSLHLTAETPSDGMVERDFTVGDIPGVLWSSAARPRERAPLVLMGHGGGNHKKHPAMAGRAQRLVQACGFHVAVIDAPGHGDRPRTAHDEEEIAVMQEAMATGVPVGPIVVRYNAHLAEQAVPEWQVTLADHCPGRVRPPVGRRAHLPRARPRTVRRFRLEGEVLARELGQAQGTAQVRGGQCGPLLRPSPGSLNIRRAGTRQRRG